MCGMYKGYQMQATADVTCAFVFKVAPLMHEGTYSLTDHSDAARRDIHLDCFEGVTGNLACKTPSGGMLTAAVRY